MSADAKADQLTMYCVPKATPVNGEWRPHVLKARRILVKSWICLLLVHEQDKVASWKIRFCVFQSRDEGNQQRNPTSSTQHCWSVPWHSQLFQTDEAFTVDVRKHTHTARHHTEIIRMQENKTVIQTNGSNFWEGII